MLTSATTLAASATSRNSAWVVPEIEIPGHSQAAIAAYASLGKLDDRRPLEFDVTASSRVRSFDDTLNNE